MKASKYHDRKLSRITFKFLLGAHPLTILSFSFRKCPCSFFSRPSRHKSSSLYTSIPSSTQISPTNGYAVAANGPSPMRLNLRSSVKSRPRIEVAGGGIMDDLREVAHSLVFTLSVLWSQVAKLGDRDDLVVSKWTCGGWEMGKLFEIDWVDDDVRAKMTAPKAPVQRLVTWMLLPLFPLELEPSSRQLTPWLHISSNYSPRSRLARDLSDREIIFRI